MKALSGVERDRALLLKINQILNIHKIKFQKLKLP
jgi:hypothetical protein